MSDKEILEKYVNLEKLCFSETEKMVMDLFYKDKDAFSLRYEMNICPNIEVEIDVTDNLHFSLMPYHINKEDKVIFDTEMNKLCYFGIIRDVFFSLCKSNH